MLFQSTCHILKHRLPTGRLGNVTSLQSSFGLHSDFEKELAATCLNLIGFTISRDWKKAWDQVIPLGKIWKSRVRDSQRSRTEGKSNSMIAHRDTLCLRDFMGMEPWALHGRRKGRLLIPFNFLKYVKKGPRYSLFEHLWMHWLQCLSHKDIQPLVTRKDQDQRWSQDAAGKLTLLCKWPS